jgi:hypothetical protein
VAGDRHVQPIRLADFIMREPSDESGLPAPAEIAFTARPLGFVARLLSQHRHDRAIVFTEDNATVYLVSRRFGPGHHPQDQGARAQCHPWPAWPRADTA